MPLGGWLGRIESLRPDWLRNEFRHGVIALGGGALFSAVALVLVPEGSKHLHWSISVSVLIIGGAVFMGIDVWLAKHKSPASQLVAMLADFVPESLALGSAFAAGSSVGPVLAIMIGVQNLPEGFNAFREMKAAGHLSPTKLVSSFFGMSFLGPLAGLIGYLWLSQFPTTIDVVMLFAAGGILYLTFEDVAPQARLENSWLPPLGAVLGFAIGLTGHLILS